MQSPVPGELVAIDHSPGLFVFMRLPPKNCPAKCLESFPKE